ncbi:SAM-dependent methyltransferase [Streptomyces broussonetiae]|uniref:S-adenosyl-L-methionine-dependent methyltransferase n=1 Tax=Streptomyces broussonetiae TaxID=2686304 RepID=A0ABV5EM06_9ACTN
MPDTAKPPHQDGLSRAAFWTAAAHAAECRRPAPYVRDPWAADFLHAAGFQGGPPGEGLLRQLLPDWFVVRSRFFDEHLVDAARAGCRQVVLIGAGLDTRAYRLDWPTGVHVLEIEEGPVVAFKERVLDWSTPSCGRRGVVAADPAGPWREDLLAAGFDPGRPTAWHCEAPLYFRRPEEVERIVDAMTELSAPGSVFSAECVNAATASSSFVAPFLDALHSTGISWRWQLAEPEAWWAEHGWHARVADPFTLPYVIERLSPYLPLLSEAAAKSVFLTTGTLREAAA